VTASDRTVELGRKQQAEARRLFAAIMLTTDLEVCKALLRGERVHRTHLDPEWLRRFGA
jgi:hypothetical protein